MLNSLGKLGANTVAQVLHLTSTSFAEARGVGAEQIKLLGELKVELRGLLGHSDAVPVDRPAPNERSDLAGAGAAEAPRPCDDRPIDTIWEIWSRLPVVLRNCLGVNGILTVGQVLAMEPADFAKLRGVGAKRVEAFLELREALECMHLQQDSSKDDGPAPHDEDAPAGSASPAQLLGETVAVWPSLAALLRDVASRVSMNRAENTDRERNLQIWLSHHGLDQAGEMTLDAIGAAHGLTRERVRQIVSRLTGLVAGELERSKALAPFRTALQSAMAECLGMARAEDLARVLQEKMGWAERPTLEALEALSDIVAHTPLRLHLHRGEEVVEHPDACEHLRQRVAEKMEALLQEIHESEHILDFVYHLTQACRNGNCRRSRSTRRIPCCGGERGETNLPRAYVTALLSEVTPSPLDGDRVWGYWWTRLRIRRPKREAVRAALHILGQPVHYSELTEFICRHNPTFAPSDDRYVLTQLINGADFVLTGKLGTYGLREWGVEEYYTVSERVEQLLGRESRFLSLKTILREMKAQGIPEANIRAALAQRKFVRDADGLVGLAEWDQASLVPTPSASSAPVLVVDDEDAGYIL